MPSTLRAKSSWFSHTWCYSIPSSTYGKAFNLALLMPCVCESVVRLQAKHNFAMYVCVNVIDWNIFLFAPTAKVSKLAKRHLNVCVQCAVFFCPQVTKKFCLIQPSIGAVQDKRCCINFICHCFLFSLFRSQHTRSRLCNCYQITKLILRISR